MEQATGYYQGRQVISLLLVSSIDVLYARSPTNWVPLTIGSKQYPFLTFSIPNGFTLPVGHIKMHVVSGVISFHTGVMIPQSEFTQPTDLCLNSFSLVAVVGSASIVTSNRVHWPNLREHMHAFYFWSPGHQIDAIAAELSLSEPLRCICLQVIMMGLLGACH